MRAGNATGPLVEAAAQMVLLVRSHDGEEGKQAPLAYRKELLTRADVQ